MANISQQFFVDNESPTVSYYPRSDYSPVPDYAQAWNIFYTNSGFATAPGQVGSGTSYHITSLDGASFSITWNGTGINLEGSAVNASFQVALDGTSVNLSDTNPEVLASFSDLPNTAHTVSLTVTETTANSYLKFDKALVSYGAPIVDNSPAHAQTISDTDIAFLGQWSNLTDSTGASMHISSTAGDCASTTFQGSALTLYGLVSAFSGNYTVTIDNHTTQLSAISSYNNSNALLYYVTDLEEDTPHLLTIANMENSTFGLRAGGVNVTSFGNIYPGVPPTTFSESTSTVRGTIAALVLAGVIILLLLGGALYYFKILRPHNQRLRQEQANLCSEKHDDVLDIRHENEDTEDTSLSTSKGYGFGLGLGRGFPFTPFRKNKEGTSSNGKVSPPQPISTTEIGLYDEDDDKYSSPTLDAYLPTLLHTLPHAYVLPLESENLAPGWSNPVAQTQKRRRSIPRHQRLGSDSILLRECEGDADAETLSSRRGEHVAATLTLCPRTSEAPQSFGAAMQKSMVVDGSDGHRETRNNNFLQVRETSPFRVDVSAFLGSKRSSKSTRRTSGRDSQNYKIPTINVWSGQNDQSAKEHGMQTNVAIPLLVVKNKPAGTETLPTPAGYSFLDFTSSTASSLHHSKTTGSSYRDDQKHDRDVSQWSYNTNDHSNDNNESIRQDAPLSVSYGVSPKSSVSCLSLSLPTTHGSSPFPFPITIPPSPHLPHPYNNAALPNRQSLSAGGINMRRSSNHLHPFHSPPPVIPSPVSPTESIPFSVSDIHFRHSDSEDAGPGSRPTSTGSHLPPHPPLPNRDGSLPGTPTAPPPPYIVQRVLGMSPIIPTQPRIQSPQQTTHIQTHTPPISPPLSPFVAPFRIGSLLGPRPRPSTASSSSQDHSFDVNARPKGPR